MSNQPLAGHDLEATKKAHLVLRAINHKLRRTMLDTISAAGKMTVTEIFIKLRLEQSVASQHLRILRETGFVSTERDGKFIYYSVNNRWIETVNEISKSLIH